MSASSVTPSLLEVSVSEDGQVHAVAGELCLSTVELLREPLFESIVSRSDSIVVDLTRCTFIDSSGLEVLARASWRLGADRGRELVVVSPRGPVRRILDLTGMDHILTVLDSRDQAPRPPAARTRARGRSRRATTAARRAHSLAQ
ncbi:MAG TPA: STAS domain-containing protein [Solirubrobacterales bacterium]|jgi:anti-sigma B factor antagonist|nr:STAS domain-containing protein [Solirubrobacterales bacterium]